MMIEAMSFPFQKVRKDIYIDLFIMGAISVGLSALLSSTDFFNVWHELVHHYDGLDLGAWSIVIVALLMACSILAVRYMLRIESLYRDLDDTRKDLRQEREIKARNEKLASVGEVAGGMAHEINNALQPAIGMSEILQRRLKDNDPKLTEYVGMIYDSSIQARNIVQNVLYFARGKYMNMEFVPLNEAITDSIESAKDVLPESVFLNANTDQLKGHDDDYLLTSRAGLTQVLEHVFKNASDAMENKGRIDLDVTYRNMNSENAMVHDIAAGLYVCLRVRDYGSGMNEEVLSRAFDPFFTNKSVDSGTGLGLATSYGLMRQFEGIIYAESVQGEGSTFYLLLPVKSEADRPEIETEEDLFLA